MFSQGFISNYSTSDPEPCANNSEWQIVSEGKQSLLLRASSTRTHLYMCQGVSVWEIVRVCTNNEALKV